MLKGVKKGIKKKIKGKKDKKEDDLFDPAQLEKYKRELEEAKKARQGQEDETGGLGASAGPSGAAHEDDEEWLRFQQLTSGVDAMVNKVTEDLDRIKESSFFQRNKPSEQNKLWAGDRPKNAIIPEHEQEQATGNHGEWVNIEGEELSEDQRVPVGERGSFSEGGVNTTDDPFNEAANVAESPEPVELEDSLFDTTFVDAIAAGDIKLSYIPDSPTHDDEDDPFDTSAVADVVKRIEEEEKRQKRMVNLGSAVEALSGKGDKTAIARPRVKAAETKAKARPRPHAVNLLGDFDESCPPTAPVSTSASKSANEIEEKSRDIFDQILDSQPEDTSVPLLDQVDMLRRASNANENKDITEKKDIDIKDVISEFDIINELDPIRGGNTETELPVISSIPTSIPSSIAALLTTSAVSDSKPPEEDDDLDDEFAALAAESIHKGPSPTTTVSDESKKDEEKDEEEEDPFDTSFVAKTAVHGKCELKILEDEFIGEVQSEKTTNAREDDGDDDFDFNPRLGESPPKNLQIQNAPKKNPLEDMSPVASKAPAIQPHVTSAGPSLVDTTDGKEVEDVDPFDTSKLETVLPGKAELKLLEEELLSSVEQAKVGPPKLPDHIASAIVKSQTTVDNEDEFDFDPRKDEIKHHPLDLPHVGLDANDDAASKVLTPQQEREVEIDPFDTSAVSAAGLIPGPLELKLLESELVSPTVEERAAPTAPITTVTQSKITRTFSDDDFDPREGLPPPAVAVKPPQTTEDIFDSAMDFAVDKPLTPTQEAPSAAAPEPKLCPTNTDDPFDTSGIQIENYLAKSELKQVEEELLNAPPEPVRPSLVRPKLPVIVGVELKNQPAQPVVIEQPPQEPSQPHILEAMTPVDHSFKPLTPQEVPSSIPGVISVFNPSPTVMSDPFDTSIAEGVIPGKTEIKLLEEELGVGAGMNRSLSDDDFNPREPNHPAHQLASQPLNPVQVHQPPPRPQPTKLSSSTEPKEIDPFDTSGSDVVAPGKAELKALAAELL